MQNLTTVFTL